MRISQPSPYGSSLTTSGASTTAWFTSSTSPDRGETRSETAFTDSTSPYEASFVTVAPSGGGSKWTSSPSASCAYHVTPSTASSPSMRAQSCSGWYRRSSGYDSVAATSRTLLLVDGLLDDLRAPRLPADVDHQLGSGFAPLGRDVAEADADVEHRRERTARDLSAAFDRHPLPWDRLLGHDERDEPSLRPVLLDRAQALDAAELRVERARPTEPRRDRVPLRADVVAVEREADLQAQRVARAQPTRRDAAGEDRVPEPHGVVLHARELDAFLARVTGAVDHHLDAVDIAHRERERAGRLETEPRKRAGALHGEQRIVVGDVADVGAAELVLFQPAERGVAVRRVDDEDVPVAVDAVDDQIVDDSAVVGREQRVLRVSALEVVDVVRKCRLEQVARGGSLHFELPHVRDVEDTGVGANRLVLRDHALVLHGHLPAGERHHPRPEGDVTVVQRRAAQRLHPARC